MRETWYVLEDGTFGDPADVGLDGSGRWRHKDGRAVAMRGPDTPRTTGVDVDENAPQKSTREMTAEKPKRGYKTR